MGGLVKPRLAVDPTLPRRHGERMADARAPRPFHAGKVPAVTLAFWVIKIVATTLGETGGDVLSMTLKLGYLLSTAFFFGVFAVAVFAQVSVRRFHPWLYWLVILATTTAGTTLSDYLDRSAGLGYLGGSALLITALVAVLAAWKLTLGSVAVDHIEDRRAETFYWVTILVSNTLGTALGDYVADNNWSVGGHAFTLSYAGGGLVFGGALAVIAALYFLTQVPRTVLFWCAFVLTRPLGATVGDLLTKPRDHGGLALGTIAASAVLAAFLVVAIALTYRGRRTVPA